MLAILGLVILLSAILIVGFFNIALLISTLIIGAALLVIGFLHLWSWWLLVPLWLIYGLGSILFNVVPLRRAIISKIILGKFRNMLPTMSETEQIAAEAGDAWWEAELFRGKPDWQQLLSMPKPQLQPEEQAFLEQQVETLCEMLNDWEIVYENKDLPPKVWEYLKEQGFFGLVIGKEYGGKGFSAVAHSAIVTKVASRSVSAAITIMVPNSLGAAELLQHYGTYEQKQHYLPLLAKGAEMPCFALTATEAGSDATSMPDTGVVCRGEFNGQEVVGIRLNFDKRYITLAPVATLIGLAFKLYDPEHLLGDQEDIGITLCLVPTSHPGVEIGGRHLPLHLAFMNGTVRGKDVFIPLDWIIGGPNMRGKGWQILVERLAIGRGISLPALGTSATKLCYRMTGAYARVRKQFKTSIGKFEGVQEALAKIAGFAYICEAARLMIASAIDQGVKPSLASAISKYHMTELAREAVNAAMDIHAGKAIQLGPNNYLGLLYDAAPISITVEGANILTRNLIIFGQGAMRCHPYIRQEMAASALNNQAGLVEFDKLFFGHVGYTLHHKVRSFIYGITGGKFIPAPKTSGIVYYYRQLTRMSTALSLVSDIAMVSLGGELKRKERLSARLGDVLSYLYLGSAVLRYFNDQGQPSSDLNLVRWSLQWCLSNVQKAFDEFFANFPHRWLARCLRFIIFPFGRAYYPPLDSVSNKIADDMLQPSALRDRLTGLCYIGNEQDATGCMERAMQAMVMAEPVRIKLQNAIRAGRVPRQGSFAEQAEAALKAGILTAEEIQLLTDYQRLQSLAIQVDEFKPNLARKRSNGRTKTKNGT